MVSFLFTILILVGTALGQYVLTPLPFAEDALEPFISKTTISTHYNKHHAGYVKKLNKQRLENEIIKDKSILQIILNSPEYPLAIVNNAAQIYNHEFYWNCIKPMDGMNQAESSQEAPFGMSAKLYEAIVIVFNDFESFKDDFKSKAKKHFGSGWIWLVVKEEDTLMIAEGHDAQNPLQFGEEPLLTIDIWEHAYYLDYKNERARYVDEYFERINWKFVSEQFDNVFAPKKEL